MAMLEHVPDLTLSVLNEATQAWVEQDYNGKRHSEIDEAPITRFLAGPAVTQDCPDSNALRAAFTRSDILLTVVLAGDGRLLERLRSDEQLARGGRPLAKVVRHKLHMSQEDFAAAYGIPLDALVAWERRTAEPTATELAYLRLIERNPEAAKLVPA